MGSADTLIPPGARSFGKYELVSKLAVGGMAEIFLARVRDTDPPRLAVIKRVLPHLAEDERFVAMFRDEARLAARIEHENVCRVFELGCVGDTYFIAMEYLHGMPLSRMLLRCAHDDDPLDVRFVATIILEACRGLHCAHELASLDGKPLDVVHRDISPPNIFITDLGTVKLLDFGVAKARGATQRTKTGTVKGKNSYMSPEQILGEPVDRRSDIFSLGIVMYEALTANRLFSRESDFRTFKAITEADIPSIDERRRGIPTQLQDVMYRALSRKREDRFKTAIEMGLAVDEAIRPFGGLSPNRDIAAYLAAHFHEDLEDKRMLCAEALGIGTEIEEDASEATVIDPPPRVRPAPPMLAQVSMTVAPAPPVIPAPPRMLLPRDEDTIVDLSQQYIDDEAPTVLRLERTPTPTSGVPRLRAGSNGSSGHAVRDDAGHGRVDRFDAVDGRSSPTDSERAIEEFARAQRSSRMRRLALLAGLLALIVAAILVALSRAPG